MPVLENYYEHLYHGPVVSLRGYCAHHRLQGSILAYLDFGGATGSAKDGLAEGMLALAAEQGLLAKGQPIVEASSGTFAVALTIAARHSGHPVTLTMPEGVPDERKKLLRSLGAQLAFSSPLDGRRGAERLARELADGLFVLAGLGSFAGLFVRGTDGRLRGYLALGLGLGWLLWQGSGSALWTRFLAWGLKKLIALGTALGRGMLWLFSFPRGN